MIDDVKTTEASSEESSEKPVAEEAKTEAAK